MGFIYEPTGSARSDAALALNIYHGCTHACSYCYAPSATFTKRDVFNTQVLPRANFLKELEKDAIKRFGRGEGGHVLMSFLNDPYQPAEMEYGLTRKSIQILHATNHSLVTLTKGGTRALRDIELFTPKDEFASTLTVTTDELLQKWEPGAASFADRCDALKTFHAAGIPTWVSLEPVLYSKEVFKIIEKTHEYVGHYRIGRLNRNSHEKTVDWGQFAESVTSFCLKNGIPYFIKKELMPHLPAGIPDVYKCKRP
ncbi:MAG: radical SAM protein [Smithellaceae bacterium]|jgi:DNA repair photolyase